jgi:hypothetical protein
MVRIMKNLFVLLVILFSFNSFADRLLIISSGLGMYGDDESLNIGVERLGASLVEEALREKYSKVYKVVVYEVGYGDYANDAIKKKLQDIVKESKSDERLDVFSMQHGPTGSPFDGLQTSQIKSFIPHGFIRNVYSTSCSEFGDIVFKSNKENYVLEYNDEFSKNLEDLGVDTYMYHANMNATGAFTLPILLKHMRTQESWAKAGILAYEEFDNQAAKLLPAIQSLRYDEVINTLIPDFKNELVGWEEMFISRLVIGSKISISKTYETTPMIPLSLVGPQYSQNMVPMQESLEKVISTHCEEGLLDFGTDCALNVEKKKLHEIVETLLGRVHHVFDAYDSTGNACLQGAILNQLVSQTKYNLDFEKICFENNRDGVFKLKWKIKKESLITLREHIEINDVDGLRKITLAKSGSIVFRTKDDKTKIRIHGLKIFFDGIDGEGKLKAITAIKPNGENIFNSGKLEGGVKLLGIPVNVGIDGQSLEEIDMIDFFKLFGFRVNI